MEQIRLEAVSRAYACETYEHVDVDKRGDLSRFRKKCKRMDGRGGRSV